MKLLNLVAGSILLLTASLVTYKATIVKKNIITTNTNVIKHNPPGINPQKQPRQQRRIETSGLLVGRGPMLVSEESESGIITNTYYISPSNTIVKIIQPTQTDQLFGTKEYENIAKSNFEKNKHHEPQLGEIREILEDFPAAKNSDLLYTGIREVYECRTQVRDLRNKRFMVNEKISELLFIAENSRNESARQEAKTKSTEFLNNTSSIIPLDLNDCRERTRLRLSQLYGEIPKPIFQRLMSIEITTTPQPFRTP